MDIKNNIYKVSQYLTPECRLIAVSKTQPAEAIREAFEAGQIDFGENKVQELLEKSPQLPDSIRWHLIGHLQTNKVKYVVPIVHLIHSVDSLKLLVEIDKQARKIGKTVNCLLQMHIAKEVSKFGLDERDLYDLVFNHEIEKLNHVKILGLMGMATFTEDQSVVEAEFDYIHRIFLELKSSTNLPVNVQMEELSIGMSGDYHLALKHGSTMVRVGTAIFGERILKS